MAATELREIKLNWLPDVASLCEPQARRTLPCNGPKAADAGRATTGLLVNSQALYHLRYRGNDWCLVTDSLCGLARRTRRCPRAEG